ncbi:MAG TPA: HAMP domain-containing sensor histidine kinase [Mycobacteriales bacterium]|jgi:two-component system OmpR family sensor kinase
MTALLDLPRRIPLRVKLVAITVVLVTAALGVTAFAATTLLRTSMLQRVDSQLGDFADRAVRGGFGGPPRDGQLPSTFFVAVIGPDGTGTIQYTAPLYERQPPHLPRLDSTEVARRAGRPFTVPAEGGHDRPWRVLVTPLRDGSGSVLVGQSLEDVESTVGRLTAINLGVGAVVLVLLAGLGYVAVRSSLRPLAEVERTAEAIAAGDLSRRVPEGDPRTEVGRLGRAFNTMLGHIESAFRAREASEQSARESEERMRQFVADASHELRTPLSSIRGFAELYRQGAVPEQADVDRVMRRIEDEGVRMGLLVEDLLLLARLDAERPLEYAPVDLLAVATDVVHDARAVAPDRRLDVELLPSDTPPVVRGDDARLRQIAANLVGNAVKHTDGPVRVRVGTEPGWAVLSVGDEGPGLAPEEAARVFERFYRADPSRTRASGGTGLGLSIVAALVAAHGGTVDVDTAPGRGATFRVRLPLTA